MKTLIPLAAGAHIGVVALGSPLSPERLRAGIESVEKRGFKVSAPLDPSRFYGKHDQGFANGSAKQRVEALYRLLDDPAVGAVITARGGYGILEMLPLLDLNRIANARKAIVGISDTTALLAQAGSKLPLPLVHGPTIGDLFADGDGSAAAQSSVGNLFRLLQEPAYRYRAQCKVLRGGSGEGPVLAGNLSMLAALLGTPWDVDYTGKLLVLEEVGEAPFRIHRLFTQLHLAGKLSRLSGMVLGRFAKCESKQGPSMEDVFQMVMRDMLAQSNYPIISGLPFGHWGENQPLALGCKAAISGSEFCVLDSPL